MADVFALQRIQADIMFRNDDYVAAEKVKAINRLLEHLRMDMRSQVGAPYWESNAKAVLSQPVTSSHFQSRIAL